MQFEYTFKYLNPNALEKNDRLSKTHIFNVTSLNLEQFPIAFITHEALNTGIVGETYFATEHSKIYRAYNGKLFRQVLPINNTGIFYAQENNKDIRIEASTRHITQYLNQHLRKFRYDESVGCSSETIICKIQHSLDQLIIVNDTDIWATTVEPVYEVMQDYNGGMSGSGGMCITIWDNYNEPDIYLFNALEKEEAKEYCLQLAKKRNQPIGLCAHIEVLMPEMVKCDPQAEYVIHELSK